MLFPTLMRSDPSVLNIERTILASGKCRHMYMYVYMYMSKHGRRQVRACTSSSPESNISLGGLNPDSATCAVKDGMIRVGGWVPLEADQAWR
jgi:hypothetical protein